MKLAESSHIKANRIIGQIGFDRITLIKLIDMKEKFTEPISVYFPDQNVLSQNIAGHTLNVSVRKARIFGPGYTFSFGNQGDAPFTKIELHARETGEDNLSNLNVEGVWHKLDDAAADLLKNYQMHLRYNKDSIRIYAAEINVTFPLAKPFNNYRRIIRMLAAASSTGAKKMEVSGKSNKLETYYILNGATRNSDFYDKKKDLEQKCDIDCDCPLMRYEIYGKEQILSRMSSSLEDKEKGHPLLHLKNINDAAVRDFFVQSAKNIFSKLDDLLSTGIDFSSHINFILNTLLSSAVQRTLRTDAATFIEDMMQKFHFYESETSTALFLDLTDLISAVKTSALLDDCKIPLVSALESVLDAPEKYSMSCQYFIGQRELYEELKSKLCQEHTYEFTLCNIGDDNKRLVWWDNPLHEKISTKNMDSTNVFWQLRDFLDKYKNGSYQDYSIYKTSNSYPLIYVRKDFLQDRKIGGPFYKDSDIAVFKDEVWDKAKRIADKEESAWEEHTITYYEDMTDPMDWDDDYSFYVRN